jgi:F-type H+-transporting ATPase subunit epsilon
MAREFSLSVVAPDRSVVETTATSVILPGQAGYLGVMGGHIPMVISLRPGLLEYVDPTNQRNHVSLDGGFAEITSDRVTILADGARMAGEIDIAEEEKRLESARRALRGESSEMNSTEATQEIERAMSRIRAAKAGR